ncbi:PaaI family thioesterase [Verticiella sediminum]|nr:PaaI family thioesterase [Verticiella sediminum]
MDTAPADGRSLLADWIDDEEAALARQWPGVADPAALAGLDGLAVMRAMLAGATPYPPIAQTLGFVLVEVERGRVVYQGRPAQSHLNPMGTAHGGWFAAILDSALACAVHTLLPQGRGYTTAELSVNIVRALRPGEVRVRAIGEALHAGRQLATAQARLVGPDGTLYAHATTTCLVFETRAPG